LAVSATAVRVTPYCDPLTVTGDGSLRRLRFLILRRRSSAKLKVAPAPRVDCRVSDAGLRFPFVLHLPALPAINPRGELEGRILRRCRLIVSGLPRTASLRYRRRPSSKFPWNLHLPAPADEAPRVSSARSTFRLRQRESPGHPESSLASGSSDFPDPISPWSFGHSEVPTD